jgi:uncharacterized membrane protein
MWLLIAGLALFLGVHALTTLRDLRARLIGRLGEGPYRGLYSLASAAGLVLIVWGFGHYRSQGYIQVWDPPLWLHPVAVVLMWGAFVALAAAYSPLGKIKSTLRHPMLVSVKMWALAHLLVNGDLGSIVLFGAFLLWAGYDRASLARRGDTGAPSSPPGLGDLVAIGIGSAAYAAMWWLHPIVIGVPIA